MRFSSLQLLGLIGVQTALGLPASSKPDANHLQKRDGPGIDGELYLHEIIRGDEIGSGADGKVYKATVTGESFGWDTSTTWAFKTEYRNINHVQKEHEAFKAIDGEGIGPAFGAKITDAEHDDLPEMAILMEYIDGRVPDPNSKDDAKAAMETLKKLHDLNWVHGDLVTMSNIIIRNSDGKALLIDFVMSESTWNPLKKRQDVDDLKRLFSGVEWDDDEVDD